MKRYFKGSLLTFGVMFLAACILVGIGVATGDETLINSLAEGAFVSLICASPLVILVAIVTGIATLVDSTSGKAKRKREFEDFAFDDDYHLEEIMSRLSPEQQVYLENRLRNARLGVGTDGELMSMNELLDDFDSKDKRM